MKEPRFGRENQGRTTGLTLYQNYFSNRVLELAGKFGSRVQINIERDRHCGLGLICITCVRLDVRQFMPLGGKSSKHVSF